MDRKKREKILSSEPTNWAARAGMGKYRKKKPQPETEIESTAEDNTFKGEEPRKKIIIKDAGPVKEEKFKYTTLPVQPEMAPRTEDMLSASLHQGETSFTEPNMKPGTQPKTTGSGETSDVMKTTRKDKTKLSKRAKRWGRFAKHVHDKRKKGLMLSFEAHDERKRKSRESFQKGLSSFKNWLFRTTPENEVQGMDTGGMSVVSRGNKFAKGKITKIY